VYPVLCASSRADVHDVAGGTLPLLIHSQKRSEGLDYDKREIMLNSPAVLAVTRNPLIV